jgi:hypothetical protein
VRQVEVDEVLAEQPPACAHTSLGHENAMYIHTPQWQLLDMELRMPCGSGAGICIHAAAALVRRRLTLHAAQQALHRLVVIPDPLLLQQLELKTRATAYGIPSMQTGSPQRDATSHRHTGSATT